MKKKTAVIHFIVIILSAILLAFLTFCAFKIPFSSSNWNSFVKGMNFSGDVKSGVVSSYSISYSGDDANAKSLLRERVYETLNNYYSQPNVYIEGDNVLFVETGSENDYANEDRVENALKLIGEETTFKIYSIFDEGQITIENMKEAYYAQIAGQNALVIQLDKTGTELLKTISKSYYMCIQLTENGTPITNTSGEEITDGKVYVTGGTKASIISTIINLNSEKTGVKLTYTGTKNISATMGNNFAFICLVSLLALCLVFFILMTIKLRFLGAFGIFSLAIFAGIYTLLLNILPNIQINVGSLLGIMFSLILFLVVNFCFVYEIKKQFKEGKSPFNAMKFSFSGILKNLLDSTFVILIPLIVLMFVGSSSINSFATCLVVGLLVNLFATLVVSKNLFGSAIVIFNKHQKLIGLVKKEEAKDENK